MSNKIGVIGDGHVGSTVAQQLILTGLVDDLVMIDVNEAKVRADQLDFQDAMANLKHHTTITINDYSALKDADIVISAFGNIELEAGGERFAELNYNRERIGDIAESIKKSGFNGILVAITNPVDAITNMYQELTGLPRKHVIGTGTLLDTARMKRAVGERMNVDPRSVEGFNLGEHGNSQFTAWSTVKVLEKPITEVAEAKHLKLEDLNDEIKFGGQTVYKGKQYTNYGISAAVTRLVETIQSDAHTEMPVSNYQEKYGTYLSYPAIVGRDGIVQTVELTLTDEEEKKLQASAETIKEKANK
ncbi:MULTISPECIES: L-lactate dehydrogenase [Lactobacillus]|uniref:L-2-hydroxyisocaproate dehydrogenase n=1 Tax=Lactobacillus kullabergensis TaxID=1218493 RepID=A0A0F4LM84_9LACO|nr:MULTISPECIES: L-lactate dehydrogenase [Lactobacillus]KJY58676.1 L-2-hydroxyisocaproate dehydrogenase [Lactobacillus kullabergensis]MBC6370735.1 L-lactate dehydrogenase [Lactobacillus kullabergensis]MBI0033949.1 L-lactate dehydrogenase [Lactobacillus sp. M0396]RMC56954.1 L-lactate dehydrogenase [Lactobacillus sp. ESL0261]